MTSAPTVCRPGGVPVARPPATLLGGVEVVQAPAVLDMATTPALAVSIEMALRRRPRLLVVDLAQVRFCDSTALDVLVAAVDDLVEDRCAFELKDPPRMLIRMAALLGLSVHLGLPA